MFLNSAVVVGLRSRGFCENSRVGLRGHIGPLCCEPSFFPAAARGGHGIIEWDLNVFNIYGSLKNVNIYSTVDPRCAVIAKILQWLSGHVVFAKILGYVAI